MDKSILVNQQNKIKPKFLENINLLNYNNIQLEEETYNNFLKLKDYMKEKGIEIVVKRGFEPTINDEDYYDEFKTGLAIEIDKIIDEKILKEYGFIVRYPENKENITMHKHNPFHIRFVGTLVASLIYDKYQTLEEYKEKFSGIIVINKKKGMTSFDIVNEISKLFGIKKVGHTGTLDPMAEGVLIVCIGKATKIVELLTAKDKEYLAGVKLGIKTDTYDIEGKVIAEKEYKNIDNLEEILKSFKKTYMQEVPIYSAVKVNGKKLYEYARKNIEIELPKKEVTIKSIELINHEESEFTFKAKVSKGCYIRSLINDIGNSLNTYATMTTLKRIMQGSIRIEEAYTLDDVKNNKYKIYSIEDVLEIPKIEVNKELEFKISNGMKLDNVWNINDKVIFKNKEGCLLGIYENKDNILKVWKNFI